MTARAPRSPESRAATLAKRRETMRRRPLAELRHLVEQTAVAFDHYGEDCPPEAAIVGTVFRDLAFAVLNGKRRSEEASHRLREWADALCPVLHDNPLLLMRMVVTVDGKGLQALEAAIERRTNAVEASNKLFSLELHEDDDLRPGDEALVGRLLRRPAERRDEP